ncbi:MAG: methyltransferase domain-containing protein [Candidatus Omnitrophica bacterium]|nr:methyltransferase domain-containing protein [Candidatus Omnitrophota bacterium]
MYIKRMYNAVYLPKARIIGRMIRNDVLGVSGNIGQNCILSKKDIDTLVRNAALNKNKRVLDLCCGDGGVDIHLAKQFGCKIIGLDFSVTGIDVAKNSVKKEDVSKNCNFTLGLAEKSPFGDGSFDVIFGFDSFIHIQDKRMLLNECFRMLKPRGKLIFSDWVEMEEIPEKIQKSGELWGYIYLLDNSAYRKLISESGFEGVKLKDNSVNFKNIIARWEGINLSYRDFLIKECGLDYFNSARRRWALARELSQSGLLGQSFFVCQKPHTQSGAAKTQAGAEDGQPKKRKDLKMMLGIISDFCSFWVVNSGLKSGILSIIAKSEGPITEIQLIKESGYAERFISSWLRAAYASKILNYDLKENAYILKPSLKDILLNRNDRSYLGGSFNMFAELAEIFKLHPEFMKAGKKKPLYKQNISLVRAMADITRVDFADFYNLAIRADIQLCDVLKRGGNILDIGAGLGYGPIYFSKVYPKCKIIGIDIDKRVINIAKNNIKRERLGASIKLKLMDARMVRLKTSFDLIYMNLTLHEVGREDNERLIFLKRCYRLMKKGGKILISEMSMPDQVIDYRQPFIKMLMGLEMCEAVFGGEMLTSSVLKSLIRKAGFQGLKEIKQPDRSRIILLAQK